MAKLTIDTLTGGLLPLSTQNLRSHRYLPSQGIYSSTLGNMYVSGTQNPHRNAGYYCPGVTSITNLTNLDQLSGSSVVNFVFIDDNNIDTIFGTSIYFGENNSAKIQAIDIPYTKILKSTDGTGEFPHTIAPAAGTHHDGGINHSGFIVDDLVEYQINGVRKLLYFFHDNTDADMGSYDLISSFTTDDANEAVLSTSTGGSVLDKNFSIIPEVADNGFLYIANGRVIHKFDGQTTGGADGTMTGNVVVLSSSRTIVDMKDGLGKMWILTIPAHTKPVTTEYGGRNCSVLVWNRLTSGVGIEDNIILDDCITAYNIFFLEGIPYVFVKGGNGYIQLRKYNGRIFETIRSLDGALQPANRNAIIAYKNGIIWQSSSGVLYFFGKITPESSTNGFYIIGQSGTATKTLGGAIGRMYATSVLTSFNTTVPTISIWNPDGADTYVATLYTRNYDLPKLSTINFIDFYFLDESSVSDSTTVNVYTTSAGSAKSFNLSSTELPKGFHHEPMTIKDANKIQFTFGFPSTIAACPKLYRIEVDYTPNNKLK